MAHVGGYLYPCVGRADCTTATEQVRGLKSFYDANGMSIDSVWLDVESGGVCPWGSTATNKAFYVEMLREAQAQFGAAKVGIYTNLNNWRNMFGSTSWTNAGDSSVRIWYAHYDNSASFSDFVPFSSWTTPYAKQHVGDTTMCSMGVDKNYAPEWIWDGSTPTPTLSMSDAAPTLSQHPCQFGGDSGSCTDEAQCTAAGGVLTPSASGATGCEALPAAIKCCTRLSASATVVAAQSCTYRGLTGRCIVNTQCAAMPRASAISSARSARGCEQLPNAVQCCIVSSSKLEDDLLADAGADVPATSTPAPTSLGLIIGIVVGAVVLIVIVAVVVVLMLRKRVAKSNDMAYTAAAEVHVFPVDDEAPSNGQARFI